MGFGLCKCNKGFHENATQMIPEFEVNTNHSSQDNISPSLKSSIQEKLSNLGEFKPSINIKTILENINPLINKIEIPQEKLSNSQQLIKLPLIEFTNGEKYEGEWNFNNYCREGYGIIIYPNNKIYKGLWENNNYGNFGCFFDNNGNYYIGDLLNGKAKGKGEMFMINKFKYIGDFEDDLPCGKGILENFEDNSLYEGEIFFGIKEGKGKIKFNDGTIYEGNFKNDEFDGFGKIIYENGNCYEGDFKNNKKDGKGIFIWNDGKKYEGEFVNDIKQGKGKLFLDENKFYEGTWINDKKHGKGCYSVNGEFLSGLFRYGKVIIEKS